MTPGHNRHQPAPALTEADALHAVVKAFRTGFDDAAGCLIHGTSLGALKLALQHGELLGGRYALEGRLYVLPMPSRITIAGRENNIPKNDQRAKQSASLYVLGAAQIETAQLELGLSTLSRAERTALSDLLDAEDLSIPGFKDYSTFAPLRARGITYSQALACRKRVAALKECGGVTFAFSSEVLNAFNLCEAPDPDEGHYIRVKSGLSLKYLVGLEPHGEDEMQFLERLSG